MPKTRGPGSSTAASGGDEIRWLDGGWVDFLMGGNPNTMGGFPISLKARYLYIYPRYAMYDLFFLALISGHLLNFYGPKSPKTFLLLYSNKLFPSRKGFFPPKKDSL